MSKIRQMILYFIGKFAIKFAKRIVQEISEQQRKETVQKETVPQEVRQKKARYFNENPCCVQGCGRKRYCKKMCDSHYQSYRQAVRTGRGTEWGLKHGLPAIPHSTRENSFENKKIIGISKGIKL